ncbi:O-methyltransferase [Zychaea mexicana]|uniref:O-methyltransferase n=1 Tax=Zychaea mexicana TaxID=64656 RepID=UPI0022FF19B8|nr:O-methyltransferase [Zychaea mexicana]KAI9485151.1 O-methyltransferase [Zychaea mexicana]
MMVPETQRKLLFHLVKLLNSQNILEIGTFTGATAIAIATALPENGKLITLDIDAKALDVARKYIKVLKLEDRVDFRLGAAMESLEALVKEDPQRQFDMISIDADKTGYTSYYDFIMDNDLLSDRGVIIVDDVLFHGHVHRFAGYEELRPIKSTALMNAEEVEKWSRAGVAFNKHVLEDPRVRVTVLPCFDGFSLITKA